MFSSRWNMPRPPALEWTGSTAALVVLDGVAAGGPQGRGLDPAREVTKEVLRQRVPPTLVQVR